VVDILILLISSTWAYENAHFAYYGTKLLLADIKRLDAIIVHLEQGEITPLQSALQSAPGGNLYNF
jgi:hypothetical protein